MTYRRFEDLPVWNDAIVLATRAIGAFDRDAPKVSPGLRDQLHRAAVSVSNNIAEGFERGPNQELLTFLYIAKGSAGEVRSMLHLLERLRDDTEARDDLESLRSACEGISRQLGRWIESIKDSGFQGKRSRNEDARRADREAARRESFLADLDRIRREARDGRTDDRSPRTNV